jgi:hypothetical protein
MFCAAVWALKAHWIGPDAGQGGVVRVNLEVNRLLGLRAPTNEIAHRVAPKSKKEIGLTRSFLAAWQAAPRTERGPIKCGSLDRRVDDGRVAASRYPRPLEVAD